MDLSKKLLTLLAIFCIIASAGVVCAADAGTDDGYAGINYQDGGWAGSNYQDDGGWAGSQYNATEEPSGYAGSQYQDDGGWAGSQYNATEEPSGYAGSQYQDDGGWAGSQYNETLENASATGNATAQQAAGEPTNMTANATSSHNMLATGNPILLLLGVTAVMGGAAVLRKK